MREIYGLLSEYGVDAEKTLSRFGCDEKLYIKCLDMFYRDGNFEKLALALKDNDLENAFFAAHTLKGMAANMGFDRLNTAVCLIVEPLRAKDAKADYGALFSSVEKEMACIRELIKKAESVL